MFCKRKQNLIKYILNNLFSFLFSKCPLIKITKLFFFRFISSFAVMLNLFDFLDRSLKYLWAFQREIDWTFISNYY